MATSDEQLLRWPEIRRLLPVSRSTLWRLTKTQNFPRAIRVGQRARAWRESEVLDWLAARRA
jgi:prophage regulatory protein